MKATDRCFTGLLMLILVFLLGASGPVEPGQSDNSDQSPKISDRLMRQIESTKQGGLIPTVIVLREQVRLEDLRRDFGHLARRKRRPKVVSRLKAMANSSQKNLLQVLRARQGKGAVGEKIQPLWIHNLVVADVTADLARELATREDVRFVGFDKSFPLSEILPVEPKEAVGPVGGVFSFGGDGIECGAELMRAPEVWGELQNEGEGVIVGVVDIGFCLEHPDLANNLWQNPGEPGGHNNIDDDENGFIDDFHGWDFEIDSGEIQSGAHGTHVCGTILGDGSMGFQTGMAPKAKFMACAVSGYQNSESVAWEAVQYAVDNGADVINGSIGFPPTAYRPIWRELMLVTMEAGVVPVFSAGNRGVGGSTIPFQIDTPGNVPEIITVGATNCDDELRNFSSRGPVSWSEHPPYYDYPMPEGKRKPTVSAPGSFTRSTVCFSSGPDYDRFSGTSMACPHVTGTVALMLAANPDLEPWQCKIILEETAIDLGEEGPDNEYGAGRVDAYEAVVATDDPPTDKPDPPVSYPTRDWYFVEQFAMFRGHHTAGILYNLRFSNNRFLEMHPGYIANSNESPVVVELTSTVPEETARLILSIESKANTINLSQNVECYNWNTEEPTKNCTSLAYVF